MNFGPHVTNIPANSRKKWISAKWKAPEFQFENSPCCPPWWNPEICAKLRSHANVFRVLYHANIRRVSRLSLPTFWWDRTVAQWKLL